MEWCGFVAATVCCANGPRRTAAADLVFRPMRSLLVVSLFAGMSAFVACGGGSTTSAPASSPTMSAEPSASAAPMASASASASAEDKVVGPPDVKWADMDKKQKGMYMAKVVMPKMRDLFTAFDSKEFATVTCATCHGKDAKDRDFKMPNPGLFVLPGDAAGFGKLMKDKPNWVKFMGEKVKPEMAKLLGKEELDMKNPKPDAFGCGNCHTSKK